MSQGDRQYDLVVFGATGFVGKLLCQYLTEQVGIHGAVRWAAAGRSQAKLTQLAESLGSSADPLPSLTADATDPSSLRDLCSQTRVLVSTVGPYALYGEPVVKACVDTGTDYCDLTGEFQWIRRMIQTYEQAAQQSGARIVHCCGFDSVPSDLGVYYLQQQAQERFGKPCVRVKMRVKAAQGGVSGGTSASAMNLVEEATHNPAIQDERMDPYSLCLGRSHPTRRESTLIPVQHDDAFHQWATPFVMAEVNSRIVFRTNALLDNAYGEEFSYDEGILTGDGVLGWTIAQALAAGLQGFFLAAAFPPTRWVLKEWVLPASGEGPSPEEREQGFYDLRFWGQTVDGATLQVTVTGDRDPGYGSTSKILGQAGLCLAQDIPATNAAGGFWTPAALFKQSFIDRLINDGGLTFEVKDDAA